MTAFAPSADLSFTRLAVLPGQIDAWGLPTRPTKKTDSRSSGFIGGSVEVDAIPPDILRALVEAAIRAHFDPGELDRLRRIEASERESLIAFAAQWGQGGAPP